MLLGPWATRPTVKPPKISARNGCNLATVISTTISAMPANAATTNRHPLGDGFGQLGVGRQYGDCRIHRFSCSVARASVEAT